MINAGREVRVALRQRASFDKAKIPAMDLMQIRIAPRGEGAEQIQGARGLHVGEFHPRRVWNARRRIEIRAIDDVTAIGRQRHAITRFIIGRSRLGELPGHATKLHHGQRATEGEHHGHLQQHAEGIADHIGGEIAKAFGAIAALQHEGLAIAGTRQGSLEAPRLTGKNQRGKSRDLGFHCGQSRLVGIFRQLPDRHVPP